MIKALTTAKACDPGTIAASSGVGARRTEDVMAKLGRLLADNALLVGATLMIVVTVATLGIQGR